MLEIIRKSIKKSYVDRLVLKERQNEERMVLANISDSNRESLSTEEIRLVKETWGRACEVYSWKEYEVFKKLRKFDPNYLSHNIYLPVISHKLNNYRYTKLFEHKSLLGLLSKGDMKFPCCYVRCIDGELYDGNGKSISEEEAIGILIEKKELIVKDSSETSGGKSIAKVILEGKSRDEIRKTVMEQMAERRGRDFVIQECIVQSPEISAFNPTSINTFRVTTLYLNGKFSVCSIVFRMGRKGMTVDNWGAGGIMVNVSLDGELSEWGLDIHLNPYSSNNGVVFKGQRIKEIPSILKAVEKAHVEQFPLCKFIGWDICIDSNGEPVCIEVNSSQPGIFGEQCASGPIFGDRTQEVIEYCSKKKFVYNRGLMEF